MSGIMEHVTNEYIGAMCANFRKYELGMTQERVAKETNYSRELVSKFERGTLPNSRVFLWYIKMGIFDWIPVDNWNGWNF